MRASIRTISLYEGCIPLSLDAGYAMDGEETRQVPLPWGQWEPIGLFMHYAAFFAMMSAGLPVQAW